jgi:hypothetical protein
MGFIRDRLYLLEIKADGGSPTKEQTECLAACEAAGAIVAIEHGLDACLRRLEAWAILRGRGGVTVDGGKPFCCHSVLIDLNRGIQARLSILFYCSFVAFGHSRSDEALYNRLSHRTPATEDRAFTADYFFRAFHKACH